MLLLIWTSASRLLLGSSCFGADPGGVGNTMVISPASAVWKYLDTGTSLASEWASRDFDDSSWASGAAPLGYDDEFIPATVVGYGPDETNKYITTWFRRSFVVTNAANCQRLFLRVLRDDGVVVYLNGVEVFRDNMPQGELRAETLAMNIIEEGLDYRPVSIGLFIPLHDGTNVLAAEVHQWDPTSSDMLFDLELSCSITRGPYLQRGTPTSMMVCWRTAEPMGSAVHYGTNHHNLNLMAVDLALTNNHYLLLTNLVPGTGYHYKVGNGDQILASGPDLHFRTAPVQPRPTRIWVIGDSGTLTFGPPYGELVRSVRNAYDAFNGPRHTDVWLLLGDNAYYQGYDREYQSAFFDIYQRQLSSTPAWSTLGNHDAYSLRPDGRLPYHDIFSPPTGGEAGGEASGTKRYYSFNHGNIHFVCLDSMLSDRTTNGVMWAWLAQDLSANTNDWLIAFWHHPPYSRGNHDSDNRSGEDPELVEMRQHFLPLLEAYGVDLVLAGHSHNYERSYLLDGHYGYSTSLQPFMIKDEGSGRPGDTGAFRKAPAGQSPNQGTVYVVAGSSGFTTGGPLDHPAMFISLNELGSLVIDVEGDRLDAMFLRETGVIDDRFTILKNAPAEPLRLVKLVIADGMMTAKWKSEAGQVYSVEIATGLLNPTWSSASGLITASGATTTWSGPIDPAFERAFYRVVGH